MKRYEILKDIFYQTIEEKSHGMYKKEAYFHSLHVSILCQKLALEKNLNMELAGIIGLFHDLSQYVYHTSFQHASRSSQLTKTILEKTKTFTTEEMDCITKAIENHSYKDQIDDPYSELIKDADLLARYLDDPETVFESYSAKRLEAYTHKKIRIS